MFVSDTTTTERTNWAIIPCCAPKLDGSHPAADLYTSSTFRMQLRAALNITDRDHVLILSAKHGLLALDTIVESYDVKMGDAGSIDPVGIAAQALGHGIDWGHDVWAILPGTYFDRLDAGLRMIDVYAAPVYEGTTGIGDQRRASNLIAA